MTTAASIVNQALAQIGARDSITGTNPDFDGSPAGVAAGILYTPAINLLLRQEDYEFSRQQVPLISASISPNYPWSYAYLYPSDCVKIRSVVPVSWDKNNPQPIRLSVETAIISSVETKIILTDVPSAILCYTSSNVTENEFDSIFQETLVRYLASELAMALAGRPDFSEHKLMESGNLVQIGAGRDS